MPKKKIEKNELEKQEKENKIARVNLAVPPALKDSLETLVYLDGAKSFNAFVEKILNEYVSKRSDEIQRMEDFKNQLRDKKSGKNKKESDGGKE